MRASSRSEAGCWRFDATQRRSGCVGGPERPPAPSDGRGASAETPREHAGAATAEQGRSPCILLMGRSAAATASGRQRRRQPRHAGCRGARRRPSGPQARLPASAAQLPAQPCGPARRDATRQRGTRLRAAVDGVLLHVLAHVRILDDGLALRHFLGRGVRVALATRAARSLRRSSALTSMLAALRAAASEMGGPVFVSAPHRSPMRVCSRSQRVA